jgi:hypothetical protein
MVGDIFMRRLLLGGVIALATWTASQEEGRATPAPVVTPAAVVVQSAATPWAVIGLAFSVVSVMVNAAVIGHTQCREMTVQEAWTSALLPFAGMLFNQQHSQCGRRVRRAN